ncbi:hypothetical protein [Xylophilus sp.]|uniref:hypothetical protein n=1 Tax=Xylophilus sp. TaxID=2653893 RepID=UPI0013BDB59F|nr:hypothetical protein [Xylophilus sp.]KAF1048909.1 MAG: hypothetical protein GAK38_01024 [Xylophilus sp.]
MSHYVSHFNVRQTESGPRFVQQGRFQEYRLTVATGYDVQRDSFPVHVYVETPAGKRTRLDTHIEADSVQDAFDRGFHYLQTWFHRKAAEG